MILSKLDVQRFRIIEAISVNPHPSLNLISGNNGSGKSSLLEAIQCLSTGHSFRTRKVKELIKRNKSDYLISAEFYDPSNAQQHRAGLQKSQDSEISLRLDYNEVHTQANITRLLPVKAITPDSHKLIQDGPDERRSYLDWGLFHVEPNFLAIWQSFKRALSQRNQLLREHGPTREITSWHPMLADSANALDVMRVDYVKELSASLESRIADMNLMFHVELRYRRGWNPEADLHELLTEHLELHRRMKTTTDGPHRAEIAILVDDIPAKHVLSRGQQKVLVYLLHLAQLDVFDKHSSDRAIVLCDDLTSELDVDHCHSVIGQLLALNSQIFVTGVDLAVLECHTNSHVYMHGGTIQNVV